MNFVEELGELSKKLSHPLIDQILINYCGLQRALSNICNINSLINEINSNYLLISMNFLLVLCQLVVFCQMLKSTLKLADKKIVLVKLVMNLVGGYLVYIHFPLILWAFLLGIKCLL